MRGETPFCEQKVGFPPHPPSPKKLYGSMSFARCNEKRKHGPANKTICKYDQFMIVLKGAESLLFPRPSCYRLMYSLFYLPLSAGDVYNGLA